MTRRLALFDLDNTLLAGDSDHSWGEFLIEAGLVDAEQHSMQNDAFYADYQRGALDIDAYVQFTLAPVLEMTRDEQLALRQRFFDAKVLPLMSEASKNLLASHREASDYCLIITATNSFITSPIAEAYGVDKLVATEVVFDGDRMTGKISGTPCFQDGKVARLKEWLESSEDARNDRLSLDNSIFYSDSSNDLPLLEAAGEAIVVDADEKLLDIAKHRGWQIMQLNT